MSKYAKIYTKNVSFFVSLCHETIFCAHLAYHSTINQNKYANA